MGLAIRKLMVNQRFNVRTAIAIAVMIGLRLLSPKVLVIGSVLAMAQARQPGSKKFQTIKVYTLNQ